MSEDGITVITGEESDGDLPEIGKIKIGELGEVRKGSRGDYRLPTKRNSFLIATIDRDKKGDWIPDPIMEKIGEECTSLDVMLFSDDVDVAFFKSLAVYYKGSKSPVCMSRKFGLCDQWQNKSGQMAQNSQEMETKVFDVTCPRGGNPEKEIKPCPYWRTQKGICKPNGLLSVILKDAEIFGGKYVFRTTGVNSIKAIDKSLKWIKMLSGGRLMGIPLKLNLTFQDQSSIDKKSGKSKTNKIPIVFVSGIKSELVEASKQLAMKTYSAGELTEGDSTPEDVEEDIVEIIDTSEPDEKGAKKEEKKEEPTSEKKSDVKAEESEPLF